MAASRNLTWNGPAISAKMRAAAKLGVNVTMAACVRQSKSNHSWRNQTGVLEGSIKIAKFATEQGPIVSGTWGSTDAVYALIHELGGVIVPVRAKALAIPQADGSVRLVKSVTIPARPYLRPSADTNYPNLPDNIRRAFEGQEVGDA